MRRALIYLAAIATLLSASCARDKDIVSGSAYSDVGVIARITDFNDVNVGTRSSKNEYESRITSMYMFVFDSDDALVDVQRTQGGNSVFQILSRSDQKYIDRGDKMQESTIYILANVPESMIGTTTSILSNTSYSVTDLLGIDLDVTGLDIDDDGFPMIGKSSEVIDLRWNRPTGTPKTIYEIPLVNLYSKVSFSIQVDSEQESETYTPQFTLDSYKVVNVPKYLRLDEPATDAPTENCAGTMQTDITGDMAAVTMPNPCIHKGPGMTFYFYVPEHKVMAAYADGVINGASIYPSNLPDTEKQRFKPLLCSNAQKPMYVELAGKYVDHHGLRKSVTYKVYLGANNYNDYALCRNHHYQNSVTIKGLTNTDGGDNNLNGISIDHRVNVDIQAFAFYVERETQIDSHFEIRPIDIELDFVHYTDPKVVLEIVSPSTSDWLRFDQTASKRDYFTTNLLTITLAGNTTATIDYDEGASNKNNRVWLYIDENTTHHSKANGDNGDGCRYAVLKASFYDADVLKEVHEFTFRQEDLYTVTSNGHTYEIEYYEEYLYNFDPKDNYGNTTEGFVWGAASTQISSSVRVFSKSGSFADTHEQQAYEAVQDKFYDFADNYAGKSYTQKIVSKLGQTTLTLNDNPRTAAEYCYNKNKRDASGKVVSINWYLPAIKEIQEIATGMNLTTNETVYTKFSSFQDKWYWSSQTTYRNIYTQYAKGGKSPDVDVAALFRDENVNEARATKTTYQNGVYSFAESEVYSCNYLMRLSNAGGQRIEVSAADFLNGSYSGSFNVSESTKNELLRNVNSDAGNQSRTSVNRIRCVYDETGISVP